MKTNVARKIPAPLTHGGAEGFRHITPLQALRRSVLSTMLFEDQFYEDGVSIHDRIRENALKVSIKELADLAIEARTEHNLRHVSLVLLLALIERQHDDATRAFTKANKSIVAATIEKVIQRADELAELVALYWKDGRKPLSKQMKTGLAKAFTKFDAYNLAKYNRDAAVKLRDVLFLCHAKPKDETQAQVWKHLVDGTLATPDTWEVNLSGGADKRETFERLLRERKLGYLALLRNLRNMVEAGCDLSLVREAILARKGGAERILPFRFTAAARAAPRLEPELDKALVAGIAETKPLLGVTAVLVDISQSMNAKLSQKSDLSRMDAAATLAAVIPGEVRMFSFSSDLVEVPPRKGMAGVDAILKSQPSNGTRLFDAIDKVNRKVKYDRIIVITDEQDTGGTVAKCPDPNGVGYMVNVASYKTGVGYGKWTHLDGFSESVLKWIAALESEIPGQLTS